jgi:hypothetical protein
MTFKQTMATLKKMGTAQNVKIYKRHGAGDNLFGVSFANLKLLKKQIKTDHKLAEKLWRTGNSDESTDDWESVLFRFGFKRNEWIRNHDMRHNEEFVVEYTPKSVELVKEEQARLEAEKKRIEDERNHQRTKLWRLRQLHPHEDINKLLTIYSI